MQNINYVIPFDEIKFIQITQLKFKLQDYHSPINQIQAYKKRLILSNNTEENSYHKNSNDAYKKYYSQILINELHSQIGTQPIEFITIEEAHRRVTATHIRQILKDNSVDTHAIIVKVL